MPPTQISKQLTNLHYTYSSKFLWLVQIDEELLFADASVKAYVYVASPDAVTVTQDGNMLMLQVGETKIYVEADMHRKIMMHNLETGVKLNVSMMAFNNAGSGPLSSAQTVIPQ